MEDEEDESAKLFRQPKVHFENSVWIQRTAKEAQALYQKAICIDHESGNKAKHAIAYAET